MEKRLKIIAKTILAIVLVSPCLSSLGCGGSSEAVKPDTFAPKPPPDDIIGDEGGGGKNKAVQPKDNG